MYIYKCINIYAQRYACWSVCTYYILPPQSHRLHRDDGFVMLTDTSAPEWRGFGSDLQAFRREGLKITASPPSTSVDFLDVTFRSDNSFRPLCKAEWVTKYVHRQSNHPPSIIRNIADRINSIYPPARRCSTTPSLTSRML